MFLCRENEVLKVQLKKYVGAVQMLKREGSQGNDGKQHKHTRRHARTHARTHAYVASVWPEIRFHIYVPVLGEAYTGKKVISFLQIPELRWCVSQTTNFPFNSVALSDGEGTCHSFVSHTCPTLSRSLSAERGSGIWPRTNAMLEAKYYKRGRPRRVIKWLIAFCRIDVTMVTPWGGIMFLRHEEVMLFENRIQ